MKVKTFLSCIAAACIFQTADGAEKKPRIMFYLDCNCIQCAYAKTDLDVATIEKSVDSYVHGNVTHLLVNPNGMRAWYPSKVLEHQWDALKEPGVRTNWLNVTVLTKTKALFDKGIDIYDVALQRARKRGLQGWITMRMNDIHGVNDPSSCGLSIRWLRRPDLRRDPTARTQAYPPHAFDYAHDEVKDLYTAAAMELLERYDADGFDADWTRFPWHLTPGKERELSCRLTDVMRAIRKKAREMEKLRGHPITVSATVMSDPEEALACGMDVFEWVREGLVDSVTVANFFSCVNFNVSYREWCRRLHAIDPKVLVTPRTDTSVTKDRQCGMTLAEYCGWFERLQEQGCDDFAFFNFFDRAEPGRAKGLRKLVIEEGITRDRIRRMPRSYPVTQLDSGLYNPHYPFGPGKSPKEVNIHIGSAAGVGAVAADAGFAEVPPAETTLRLNGTAALTTDPGFKPLWFRGKLVKAVVRCTFPVSALKDGTNIVSFVGNGKARANFCELHVEPEASDK